MTETTLRRRRHSKDVKAEVLAECEQPGASIASVAMAHGINTNLVHKWRVRAMNQQTAAAQAGSAAFIPVPLPTTAMTPWPSNCVSRCGVAP
ncbi:IS66-like element accessory protein TnpA [Noviherbaspirillum pedocola]|uniref:Transposase n=1 Tax=Noviherbaspirillum pedocola TaxID=2801341 RepID=A0A934SZ86_9BURK|nr:transposase [Noviherbaspirillum pedocola]MBK4738427.1 transposase [Noviherbaspirillum pedocola]